MASAALLIAARGSPALAQSWTFDPSIAIESSVTNNVDLVSADRRRSDWVNQFTPSLRFTERGAHTRLAGNVMLPILVYLRTGADNNYVAPAVNIAGTAELVDKLFFVDASVDVSQQFSSPFGARPIDLTSATQNRYTSQVYRISPYLKGTAADGIDYEVRQTSLWTDANVRSADSGRAFYTNDINSHIGREARPVGWVAEYTRTDTDYHDSRGSETIQLGRLRGLYRADETLEVSASVGYEDNQFFLTRERGATYGAGFRWHPNQRTSLDATWEQRFFGASYHVTGDYRTPLSVWTLTATRDLSTYPQQIANLPAGSNVSTLLNSLLLSRFPDPTQRQSFVDQLIRERGLPVELQSPVSIFAQQTTLVEEVRVTGGLVGARNNVFFSAYRSKEQPIEGRDTDLTSLVSDLIDNTQVGANATFSHRLTSNMTAGITVDWSRTTANSNSGRVTRQYSARGVVSTSLSALTSVYAGVRFQDSYTDVVESYREFAAFVGLIHTFH